MPPVRRWTISAAVRERAFRSACGEPGCGLVAVVLSSVRAGCGDAAPVSRGGGRRSGVAEHGASRAQCRGRIGGPPSYGTGVPRGAAGAALDPVEPNSALEERGLIGITSTACRSDLPTAPLFDNPFYNQSVNITIALAAEEGT